MGSSRRTRRRSGGVRPAGIRVRTATLSDVPAVARIMRAAIRRLARDAYSPRELAAWSSLPGLYHAWAMTAGGERYLVAERHGGIVGYAALRASELTAVFVRPGAARRGVGAALVSAVERRARRRGLRRLFVRAARSALTFYEAMGFRGRRAIRVPLPGGGALRATVLWKTIR